MLPAPAGAMGVFMAQRYMVISNFSFTKGRPLLVSLSLHSTKAACSKFPLPGSLVRFTSNKRIFSTLKEAKSYITYLLAVYPNSPATFPVLDKEQPELFQEVSK